MSSTKRVHRLSRAIVGQYKVNVAFSTGGDGKCHLIHGATGKQLRADSNLITAVESVPHKWAILIAAICRKPDGEEYMKTEQVSVPHVIYQRDLAAALTDMHGELCKGCNPNHLVALLGLPTLKALILMRSSLRRCLKSLEHGPLKTLLLLRRLVFTN